MSVSIFMVLLLLGYCLATVWRYFGDCLLLIVEIINCYDVVHNCGDRMVIILVILHIVENHAS